MPRRSPTGWRPGGRPIVRGAARVARLIGVLRKAPPFVDRIVAVNGEPGIVRYVGGQPRSVITIETDGERITAFRNVLNPDKLAGIEPLPAEDGGAD